MSGQKYFQVMTSILAVLMLISAFCFPLFCTSFSIDMPAWLPHRLNSKMQQWTIEKGAIVTGNQYLFGIILDLFRSREFFLGWVIALFSLGIPFIKVVLVLALSLSGWQLEAVTRKHIFAFLHSISRWALTDVFIIALCIVIFKAEGFHFQITASTGLYFYAASGCFSALSLTSLMKV